MTLYDMHSHILPGIDDGAKNVEASLELIENLRNQGVKNICLTPHYYTNELPLERFLEKRQEAYEKLLPHVPEDVRVVLGAEVYVTRYLFNNSDISDITYGNSRFVLTEFAYSSTFSSRSLDNLQKLMSNNSLIPVLPHVERYSYLIANPDAIAELQNMGIIIQTNISNYTSGNSYFKRRKMLKLISEGYIDILGSDAHSFKHNTPEVFTEAIETINSKCGEGTVERMMKNASKIFEAALS